MARKKTKRNNIINWQTVGDWIDTEGTIFSSPAKKERGRRCAVLISQSEKEPLAKINRFLRAQGIYGCSVNEHKGEYKLECWRINDAKKIVENTERYYITERKKRQMKRFKEICSS
ncbi:MAG: hypothetical protein H3Z53_10985 [archaeon]|nr:hypothetical protein [archaeon]MCP8314876.1 hypothetical protein [archaeon]